MSPTEAQNAIEHTTKAAEVEGVMSEERWPLPPNWSWRKAREVAQIVGGGTPSASDESNFEENGIPWITPADLTGYEEAYIARGRRGLSQKGLSSSGARLMPAGTVLFSSRAPIGYCAIASNPISTNQGFKSLVLREGMVPEFVRYYLLASKDYAEGLASGTTFKELSGARIAEMPIPVPPLDQQRRIVARLDALLARSKRARTELARVPRLVERQRQAVLEQAFSGELTRDWRVSESLTEPETTTLGAVASDFSYGSAAKSQETGLVPVLRMGNIQDGRLDWDNLVFTSDQSEIAKYRLEPGDVLFNRTNSPELVGKTALYQGEREAIYAGYLIRIKCKPVLLPTFLTYCLNSPMGRDYCWQVKTDGVSQSNINSKKLAAFSFNLPSLKEQREVVRRIELTFARIDRAAAEAEHAAALLDRLDQATLARAFRGEL